MQEYASFLRSLVYAPNPFEPKDRVYRGAADSGRQAFGMNATPKPYRTGLTCIACHEGDFAARSDFTGGQTSINFDGEFQFFNTPQLRFLHESDFAHLTGFGANHAGETDGAPTNRAEVNAWLDLAEPQAEIGDLDIVASRWSRRFPWVLLPGVGERKRGSALGGRDPSLSRVPRPISGVPTSGLRKQFPHNDFEFYRRFE